MFDDTDYFGKEEYDIQGDDYGIFLSVCYKYCASVSFCFRKTNELTIRWDDRMEEYRIPTTQNVLSVYSHYGIDRYSFLNDYYEIRHYALCKNSLKLLREMSNSVFSWISNSEHSKPDDPAFYRSDGSVFFFSIIHEGSCYLMPRNDEDISSILAIGNWQSSTGDGLREPF